MLRLLRAIAFTVVFTASVFAQSDRGTITGTVVDSSGSVMPRAKVLLTDVATDTRRETVTTATGNYTIAALPVGVYTLSVEQTGFSRYEQSNINVLVAVTTRVDVSMKVGRATESIRVSADATMLKTESAEQSSTISGASINGLPMNYGIGAGAVRNPLSFVQLTPGATMSGWNTINVNGLPVGSFRILFEGQESNNGLDGRASFGAPVYIPKVYNGKNRAFFFFNYEKYRDRSQTNLGLGTIPTDALRNGNFSGILTGRILGTDIAGRAMMENTIYDPTTRTTDSSGRYIVQPFAGNIIPASRFDPVAVKILKYVPAPTNPASLVNNYALATPFHKIQDLPSVKIDENPTSTARISLYYAREITDKDVGQDGYRDPISIRRALHILGTNARINLVGVAGTGFPRLSGVDTNTYGGLAQSPSATAANFGPANRGAYYVTKPTALAQVTWVRGNHTYKTGGEWKIDAFTNWPAIALTRLLDHIGGSGPFPIGCNFENGLVL